MIKKNSKKVLLTVVVVGIFAVAATYFAHNKKSDKTTYREIVVQRGSLEIKVLATGTVQPENRLEIKPPIAGRIEKVEVDEGDVVKKGKILAWMSSTERAALLDAARAKGEAELKKWEDIYPPAPILAPLDGTIVLRNIEQGQVFASSDVLLVMSDRLIVKAQVDETDIAAVKLKQGAEIVLDSYPDHKIAARVNKIAFDATTVNNVTTYIVEVLPQEVPDFMRSGMTANVTFLINSKNDALLIPSEALRSNNGASTVMLKDGNKKFEREVTLGSSSGKQIEVLSGLSENDVVLIAELKLPEKGKGSSSPFAPARGSASKSRK